MCCPATVRCFIGCIELVGIGQVYYCNLAPVTKSERKQKRKTRIPEAAIFKFGCWSVGTMTPGLTEDILGVKGERKTAAINNKLICLQVDVAALQEFRLLDSGPLREKGYTFY